MPEDERASRIDRHERTPNGNIRSTYLDLLGVLATSQRRVISDEGAGNIT